MAEPPLLTLTDIALGFGGRPLFAGVTLAIQPGERLAVVGRNGAGKSTLLRIAAGLVEPDHGARFVRPGATVAYLPQAPDFGSHASLGDYAAAGLPEEERWRADSAMDGLKVAAGAHPADASGGERRRAALARLIAAAPDLMLLDEPTNHLDIEAIGWLEEFLDQGRAGFAVISHDRRFLERLTRATLWLDRGEVRRSPVGFAGFEAWREQLWAEEDAARHKLDRLIAEEGRWAVEGISARRRRNQGRVRRLAELRAERAAQIRRQGPAAMALESGGQSGKLVAEAEGAGVTLGDRAILRDVTLKIARGDRVAIVGPNGAGKTTLLRLLTGEISPDRGRVRLGTSLQVEVFDQERAALDPDRSLWETLTGDAAAGAAGGDQVMVRGRPRHVVGYLKDFLFDERQARGPVGALSGGEKARLLLARIMARPANLLVLDEPTNDLDIETLDLLQELLADFDGTVLMVSHDRDFIDRTATTTIALEGDGRAIAYAGGWSDYQAQKAGGPEQRGGRGAKPAPVDKKPAPVGKQPGSVDKKPASVDKSRAPAQKLSFRQAHRLKALPDEIARLEAEIGKLEAFLSDPSAYAATPEKAARAGEALVERQARLAAAEEEWLELESLRETLGG